jgi:hypothetical protein
MRLNIDDNKMDKIVELVQEYVDTDYAAIEDFIDGGPEGWENGDEDQQKWIDETDADKIADWVIAGLN